MAHDFLIECEQRGDAIVIAVHGELGLPHAPQLGAVAADTLRRLPRRLVIDLTRTTFVDSSGLSVLLNAKRRSVRAGIDLRLACAVPATLKLLALTRLSREFQVHPTLAEALASPVLGGEEATAQSLQ